MFIFFFFSKIWIDICYRFVCLILYDVFVELYVKYLECENGLDYSIVFLSKLILSNMW